MKCGCIQRDGHTIVPMAWRADRPWLRLRGLLARPPLADQAMEALWLVPCGAIHTIGMRYPLDVVFLDADHRVVGWHADVRPWRSRCGRRARNTIEFSSGAIERLAPDLGEQWLWHAQ